MLNKRIVVCTAWWIPAALMLWSERTLAAPPETSEKGSVQASFQPPVVSLDVDTQYLSGLGFVATASSMTVFGVVVGAGGSIGKQEDAVFGYEAMIDVARGSGTFSGALSTELGGPDLHVSVLQGGGAATLKFKPLDPNRNGYVGLLLYGKAGVDLMQSGTKTELGSAYTTSMLLGGSGGVVGQGVLGEVMDLMAFVGYRAYRFMPMDVDMDSSTTTAPEYGGNVTVHLPRDIDLSLSTVFSLMRQGEDNKGLKVYMLGVIWTPDAGIAPVVDGGTP